MSKNIGIMEKNFRFLPPRPCPFIAGKNIEVKRMNYLKILEENTKLPKTKIAQILGISKSNYSDLYSDLEKGKILSIKHAIKLSNHFHVSLDYIYSDYITTEDCEKGVVDLTQIVVNAKEYNLLSTYRVMGEKFGIKAQNIFDKLANVLIENF